MQEIELFILWTDAVFLIGLNTAFLKLREGFA